jgi:hypothetical protein
MMKVTFEKRESPRVRVLQSGQICEGDGVSTECRIVNLSDCGALLDTSDAVPVPTLFPLKIRDRTRSAEVRWRRGRQVGIRFSKEATQEAELTAFEQTRDLHLARAENKRLKTQVDALLMRFTELGCALESEV